MFVEVWGSRPAEVIFLFLFVERSRVRGPLRSFFLFFIFSRVVGSIPAEVIFFIFYFSRSGVRFPLRTFFLFFCFGIFGGLEFGCFGVFLGGRGYC